MAPQNLAAFGTEASLLSPRRLTTSVPLSQQSPPCQWSHWGGRRYKRLRIGSFPRAGFDAQRRGQCGLVSRGEGSSVGLGTLRGCSPPTRPEHSQNRADPWALAAGPPCPPRARASVCIQPWALPRAPLPPFSLPRKPVCLLPPIEPPLGTRLLPKRFCLVPHMVTLGPVHCFVPTQKLEACPLPCTSPAPLDGPRLSCDMAGTSGVTPDSLCLVLGVLPAGWTCLLASMERPLPAQSSSWAGLLGTCPRMAGFSGKSGFRQTWQPV